MRLLKRIGIGILLTLLALVVFLLGSIIVDGFFAQDRLDLLTNLSFTTADGAEVRAYLAKPEGEGPFPAVIMIHEFWGIRPDLLGKADALAAEGYVVLAPNLFRSGTTNWLPRAIYNVITADDAQIDGDADAAYQWLAAQPDVQADRIAIMGFCFGGGTALRYSLSNNHLAATAVFYGQPITDPEKLKALSGPVLGIFGGADVSIPQAEVAALEAGLSAAGIAHEITVYEGQPHAFVGSIEEIAAGGADQEAWQQLLDFLHNALSNETGNPAAHSLTQADAARGESSLLYIIRLGWSHFRHL